MLTSLGTLEFNYMDGRRCHDGGVPVNAWEIDPAGYSSATARPYDSIKLQVRKVVIHSSWPQVGMTNASYLFNSFQYMTEVSGFENMSGIASANQMFTSCPALETIYATSFSNSGLSGSLMFNGCNRLVGRTDGFVPSSTSGASVCKLGPERPHDGGLCRAHEVRFREERVDPVGGLLVVAHDLDVLIEKQRAPFLADPHSRMNRPPMNLVHPPELVLAPVVVEVPASPHPVVPRPNPRLHVIQGKHEPKPAQVLLHMFRHPVLVHRIQAHEKPSISRRDHRDEVSPTVTTSPVPYNAENNEVE